MKPSFPVGPRYGEVVNNLEEASKFGALDHRIAGWSLATKSFVRNNLVRNMNEAVRVLSAGVGTISAFGLAKVFLFNWSVKQPGGFGVPWYDLTLDAILRPTSTFYDHTYYKVLYSIGFVSATGGGGAYTVLAEAVLYLCGLLAAVALLEWKKDVKVVALHLSAVALGMVFISTAGELFFDPGVWYASAFSILLYRTPFEWFNNIDLFAVSGFLLVAVLIIIRVKGSSRLISRA